LCLAGRQRRLTPHAGSRREFKGGKISPTKISPANALMLAFVEERFGGRDVFYGDICLPLYGTPRLRLDRSGKILKRQ
jgi:hypothetical protein